MNQGISFTSDSSIWHKPLSDVVFTLREKEWSITIGNQSEQRMYYSDIKSIRLNYALGGKNAPNKYCCTIRMTDKKYYKIKVIDRANNKQKIQEYKSFVELLIGKIQQLQPQATMRIGFNIWSYRLLQLFMTIVLAIFASVLIYFTTEEGRKEMNIPIMLFITPIIAVTAIAIHMYHMLKYRPRVLNIFDTIPNHVFPK